MIERLAVGGACRKSLDAEKQRIRGEEGVGISPLPASEC